MDWVDYKQIQNFDVGITPLFVDYLNDFEKLKDYYAADFRDRKSWKKLIDKVLSKQKDRSTLIRVLTEQNKQHHCGIRTLANIDLLGNENTVAVVTCQQFLICSGPLYTIYKTVTAIKLAEQLSTQFPITILSPYSGSKKKTMILRRLINSMSSIPPAKSRRLNIYLEGNLLRETQGLLAAS